LSTVTAQYEHGIGLLLDAIGGKAVQTPGLTELRDRVVALAAVISDAERLGDADRLRRERNSLVSAVNRLALDVAGLSFPELCGLGISYADWRRAEPWLSPALNPAEFSIITDQWSAGFTGRQWLIDEITEKVNATESGYLILTGAPGWGKTAVVAELVRRQRWIHHYLSQGLNTGRALLESVCAQLLVTYRLPASPPLYLEDQPLKRLYEILEAAAANRGGWPVVIVIDGLDQTEPGFTQFMPNQLPRGVFFVVTTRPEGVMARPLSFDASTETIAFDHPERAARNANDVTAFIESFISANDDMTGRIATLGMDRASFTAEVLARGRANFLYTKLLLKDILTGRIKIADLDQGILPGGLENYYGICWKRMRERAGADFERRYLPVAAQLVSSARPRTVDWLVDVTHLSRHEVMLVLDAWQPFFVPAVPGSTESWRVYHPSFQEFLHGRVGLEPYRQEAVRQIAARWGIEPEAP
jgi:AAA ATPase domain